MQSGELTNEKMTSRQRIMAVLQGRTPDRVPWVPLTGRFYVSSLPALGLPIEEFAPPDNLRAISEYVKQHPW